MPGPSRGGATLRRLAGFVPLALLLATPALAADPSTASAQEATPAPAPGGAPGEVPAAPPPAGDRPTFTGSLYFWASALNGTTSTLPPLPAVGVDLSFSDVMKNFDGGLMGAGEMRIGRWGFLGDFMLSQVSPDGTMPGPDGAGVEVRSRSLTLQASALYRLYESAYLSVDAGAGLRFWHLDNRLTIDPGRLPSGLSYSRSENWVDPVIAGRLNIDLGGPWGLTLYGDVGGFDIGSDVTWQAIGTVNYQWNDKLALRLGYRALSVDYHAGSFAYDVRMQGPVIGASYRF